MAVEGQLGRAPDGPHEIGADRDVGDEMAVHDVHVDRPGAAALGRGDLLPQAGEIGRQDRGREDQDPAPLISIVMAVLRPTR